MSLSLNTPSAGNSPSSDGSSALPLTPDSQTASLPVPAPPAQETTQMKRKPSRRANTAERRATHNAVERQRRETLNGRFLDLAGLLPNLSQIRRPSKSSIVNSSIAHVHAARRHRLLASRELRTLKLEADALRRELNEWRDRAQLPRVEEPLRSEGFTMVLSGEVEVLANIPGEDDEDDGQLYDGYDEANDEFAVIGSAATGVPNPFAHNLPTGSNGNVVNAAQHIATPPRSAHGGPMIATNPSAVSFENPAMASLYEPHHHHQGQQQQQQQQFPASFMQQQPLDMMEKWGAHLFPTSQMQAQTQRNNNNNNNNNNGNNNALFTPPASAHGQTNNGTFSDHAFFANMQRQQQQLINGMGGHLYSSPEADDTSSVGSNGRERSGSGSFGSTPPSSVAGSFDLASVMGGGGDNRRSSIANNGLHINTGGVYADAMGLGMMKQALSSPPISVGGGGGNGGGFMSMMF